MAAEDAMELLAKVTARAKELYEVSDQGEWDDLPSWMQKAWIDAADRELRKGEA